MLTGMIIGVVVALTMTVVNRSKAKKGTGLPGMIEHALRDKGPMTLKQVATHVGKDSFMGRGDVAQALAAMQSIGKLRASTAPAGTPQLKKVDFITYELVATDARPPGSP